MRITPLKTRAILPGEDLFSLLDRYVTRMPERSILALTSKVVSLCEGRVAPVNAQHKGELVAREADLVLASHRKSRYGIELTVKNGTLIPNAGIDESNGAGTYVLWPKNSQKSANRIRAYLTKRFKRKDIGVIITDSTTRPLRWGTVGTALAVSGFCALNDYIGKPDIFGAKMRVTKASVAEGLAAAAVLTMGEGAERTPLALITEVPFISFTGKNPTKKELDGAHIALTDDLYAPLLTAVKWKKSGTKNHLRSL